jgi:serine/threonine-protein kinase
MSPEQACGEPADTRSDIYALGAVMYEMLAGRKPFQSHDTEKLLQMIALKTPPAPHEVNPEVPEALSQIVMKAMQKRPEKRYQHAHEMANDIKRYLVKGKRPQPPRPEPENEEENATSGSGRRWLFWLAGLLALAGGAAALAPRFLH